MPRGHSRYLVHPPHSPAESVLCQKSKSKHCHPSGPTEALSPASSHMRCAPTSELPFQPCHSLAQTFPLAWGLEASPQGHHCPSQGQVLGEAPALPPSTPHPLSFHPAWPKPHIPHGCSFMAGAELLSPTPHSACHEPHSSPRAVPTPQNQAPVWGDSPQNPSASPVLGGDSAPEGSTGTWQHCQLLLPHQTQHSQGNCCRQGWK